MLLPKQILETPMHPLRDLMTERMLPMIKTATHTISAVLQDNNKYDSSSDCGSNVEEAGTYLQIEDSLSSNENPVDPFTNATYKNEDSNFDDS